MAGALDDGCERAVNARTRRSPWHSDRRNGESDLNNPEWLEKGHYTSPQFDDRLHDYIRHSVEHFRGHVLAWDVVNEALDEHGKLRPSIWNTSPDYAEQAFRWAREADPKAVLFHNEAEAEGRGQTSDAVHALVKDLKKRGSDQCCQIADAHPQFAI